MRSKPFLSLVVPCFKVSRYLPRFLASLDSQVGSELDFELIFVVDGCPEDSEEIIQQWQERTECTSRLLVTENRGVSAARSSGLGLAEGEWVSFPDPDDELDRNYIARVSASLRAHPEIDLLATRLVKTDAEVTRRYNHPLDYKYAHGSRVVNLETEPNFLQLAVHTAFFRRRVLETAGIRFDSRLKVFEDGKFVAQYLLASPRQSIAVADDALYFYKVRADGSGALQSSGDDLVARYLTTIEHAHLELLKQASPNPPRWLENMILYDFYWLFAASARMKDPIHGASQNKLRSLRLLVKSLLLELSHESMMTFNVINVQPEIRAAWLVGKHGYVPERWVRRYRTDKTSHLTEYRYLSGSPNETESISSITQEVTPAFSKWRVVKFFGEAWLYERILWIPAGSQVQFSPNDADSRELFGQSGKASTDAGFADIFGWIPPDKPRETTEIVAPGSKWAPRLSEVTSRTRTLIKRVIRYVALLPPTSSKYKNAWVLMDRDTQANDNAEVLYRYLLRHQPQVNAFFVLRKSSPDFSRLRAEGFAVLPFGGVRHFIAMRNCSNLLSSHIDEYVVRPFARLELGKTWNFVFLQHGVTQNDLSRWLNSKDIQLIVSATQMEAHAFTEDFGPYIFTEKEVLLSGFPRHDRLVEMMEKREDSRRSILIMPTWRSYLLDESERIGNDRRAGAAFATSKYVKNWRELLNSPLLHEVAQQENVDIVLLPHPNLEPFIKHLECPDWVRLESYRHGDAAKLVAMSILTVTDYSSQAFEGAFCFSPCVYFQFDREEFFGGNHIGSPGYFDVDQDGFGPVATTPQGAASAIRELICDGSSNLNKYSGRIQALYPHRDGKSSERVFDAVRRLVERSERR